MFAKTLLTAAASAILVIGFAQVPAFAFEGGGGGGGGGGEPLHLRTPAKPIPERNAGRIQWRTLPNGTVEAVDTGAGAPAGNGGDFAVSHDTDTGQRTGSFETGGGRFVISIGPLGIGFGPSMW